jgi:hypothetical protein
MHDIYFAIVCSLIILLIAINYYNNNINYKLPNKKKFAMLNNKIINNEKVIIYILLLLRNKLDSFSDEKIDTIGLELMIAINNSHISGNKLYLDNLLSKKLNYEHVVPELEIERDDCDDVKHKQKNITKKEFVFRLINHYIYLVQLNMKSFINLDNMLV